MTFTTWQRLVQAGGVNDETLAKGAFQKKIISEKVRHLTALGRPESRNHNGHIVAIQAPDDRQVSKSFSSYIIGHQGVSSTEDGRVRTWKEMKINIPVRASPTDE